MNKTMMAMGLAAACLTVSARDLVWTGSASGNWNTTDKNWYVAGDESKTPVAFANGDAVTFDDSAAARTCTVTGTGIAPSHLTFDFTTDFTLVGKGGNFEIAAGSGPVDKYGTGTLLLSGNLSQSTSTIHIWKGAIKNISANTGDVFGGFRKIYVHDGGKLWFYERNCGGDVTSGRADVVVYTNGVFDVNKTTAGVVPVRSLTLDGGSLAYGTGGNNDYGTLKIEERFAVRGTEPYVYELGSTANNWIDIGYQSDTTFDVPDITGDATADLTLGLPLFRPKSWAAEYGCHEIVKVGAGKMVISVGHARGTDYAPPGVYRVKEGELAFSAMNSVSCASGNPIVVNTNATLRFAIRNVLTSELSAQVKRGIVVDHGTFILEEKAGERGHHPLGPLTLDHATFDYTGAYAFGIPGMGLFTLGGDFTFIDDQPGAFTTNGMLHTDNAFIHLSGSTQELRIGKTAPDAAADFRIALPLRNRVTAFDETGTAIGATRASGFIKTGPGTLQLESNSSNLSGPIEIREGTVRIDRADFSAKTFGGNTTSYLGDMSVAGRQIVVSTNGTLHIAQRNVFASMSAPGVPAMKTELLVRGGTLVCSNGTGAAVGCGIGNLTLDDGKFVYATKGNGGWGYWQINDTFKLTGTKPYDFPINPAIAAEDRYSQTLSLVPGVKSTFWVDDITKDGAVDASFELHFAQPTAEDRTKYVYGLTKAGAGTLRMAQLYSRGDYNPNGTNLVAAGTLQFDSLVSGLSLKMTLVQAGAFLCGTGKVTNVEIEQGGGFKAVAGRTGSLAVTGNLKLPANGTVDFYIPDGVDPASARVDLATVSGTIDGPADFSGWTITVNGAAPTRAYALRWHGKTLRASAERGFAIIFR